MCDDSVRLAQAYSTLRVWRTFYSDAYAHACYHYGKLLRANDDPVAAMQVFIDATHSRTRDYHILGRVYSNMGSISHLADEYQLSYDMYKRSAEMYLQSRDTLLYYYDLNNMAFELAEQDKKDDCKALLSEIEAHCTDRNVLAKVLETKAEMYLKCLQNDSAINWARLSLEIDDTNPTCFLIEAQAFSRLGMNDSALFYANIVLNNPYASNQNIFNALYYTSHYDSTLCSEEVRLLTSHREDIRYYEYEPQKERLTIAIQLLKQDLHRKPNLAWLYAIFITLIIIGAVLLSYVMVKRRRHQLLSQQISDLEIKNRETIEQKRNQIEANCIRFSKSKDIKTDLCWSDYEKMCDIINQYFYLLAKKLQLDYNMSEREVRVCVLSLFDYGYERMADLLFYAPTGVGKLKVRVARKVGTTAKNLRHFLIEKAINN